MLFKMLSGVESIFNKYKHLKKIVKAAKIHLGSNTPSKDKFLGFYRYCQFNSKDTIDETKNFIEKYKDKPLNDEHYRKFKSHMKAAYFVMLMQAIEVLATIKDIDQNKLNDIRSELENFLNKSEHLAPRLLKKYVEAENKPQGMVMLISNECFDGKIKFNSITSQELQSWFYNFRNTFEMKEIGTGYFNRKG